jgi:hypothetical protein
VARGLEENESRILASLSANPQVLTFRPMLASP